jgi:hypothetical protein
MSGGLYKASLKIEFKLKFVFFTFASWCLLGTWAVNMSCLYREIKIYSLAGKRKLDKIMNMELINCKTGGLIRFLEAQVSPVLTSCSYFLLV